MRLYLEQLAQLDLLVVRQATRALEQAPAAPLQHRLIARLRHAVRLGGADLIERQVHLGHDVEAVENVQRVRTALLDHLQVGLPHVRTDEGDLRAQRGADLGEESLEALDRALLADPQQTLTPRVELVDQGQVPVAAPVLDLVHADRRQGVEAALLQPPLHHELHGVEDFLPGGAKAAGGLLP